MKEAFIYGLLIVYFFYSLINSVDFYKTDKYYTKRQKRIHTVLIWLIPFIYSMLLKELGTRTKGSNHFNKTKINLGQKGNNKIGNANQFGSNFNDSDR